MSELNSEQIQDFKKRESEEFQKSELHAYRILTLIKDIFNAGDSKWGLELLLKSEPLLDDVENFNEAPKLADLLFDYDKKKAISWLLRSEEIARWDNNYSEIMKIAAIRLHDYAWTARCLKKGFDVIRGQYLDNFDNDGLASSPEQQAAKSLEDFTGSLDYKLNDEENQALQDNVKPILRAIYEFWEEELWGLKFYDDTLVQYLEYDFPEETEWINRLKEKI